MDFGPSDLELWGLWWFWRHVN